MGDLLDPRVRVKISRPAVYAIVARSAALVWSDGGLPYRDVFNQKPPMTIAVYRLCAALSGSPTRWRGSSPRAEVLRVIDIFRGKVVDVSPKSYAVEVTGSVSKLRAIIDILKPIGIQEIVRTGVIAMPRAKKN